jgi:predicted amidohydrolase
MTMPGTSTPFIAACVQMRTGRMPGANVDQAASLIREAAAAGAAYVQTPEMTNILERDRDALFAKIAIEPRDPTVAAFRQLARELRIHLHAGSLAILREDGKVANRGFLIGPDGEIAATYDKLHLFDVDLPDGKSWRESATFTGGERAVAVDTDLIRIGMTICYDVRFPYLYRALAQAGCGLLSAPAAFTRTTGKAHWLVLQRARAIETGAFMVSAAQAGLHEDGRETYGHSMIVDPWGVVLAEAGREPGVILATIDPAAVGRARDAVPCLQHTRPIVVDVVGAAAPAKTARSA